MLRRCNAQSDLGDRVERRAAQHHENERKTSHLHSPMSVRTGVKALTEVLALELASDHILVNAIAPGPILAPPTTSADQSREVEQATPLGRWGGEHEIAKAVLAMLDSDFTTGETIRVDGGRHVK